MTPPRKRTKQERLIALTDAYRAMFSKKEWTTREVADWATSHSLFPVPGMRDAIELHTRWNERFAELTLNMDW